MPETRQKLQLKGAAVSLYLPAVHPPLPPPIFPSNCSLVDYSPPREARSNALPLFILSVRSVPLSRSRAILDLSPRSSYHRNILKSFVYSLLANRRRREIERREEGKGSLAQDLRILRLLEEKGRSATICPSCLRARISPREGEGRDRFRWTKSTTSSDTFERERWRGEDREKKVIGEVRICVWLFPGNAARFIFIPRKTAPPLLELTFRGVSESGKKIASLHAIAFCLPSLDFEKRLVLLFQHKYLLPSFLLSSPLPSTPLMDLSETRRFL